jgi:hypothetical protein
MNLGASVHLSQEARVHYIGAHCDNVFDRAYRDHLSVAKAFLPQPGRGFRLNYEVLF